jgi:hypothetical protein
MNILKLKIMKKIKKDKSINLILKVQFINTYTGDLGIYYKGKIYELPYDLYEKLKNDCREVE